jgi:hypothetical protein
VGLYDDVDDDDEDDDDGDDDDGGGDDNDGDDNDDVDVDVDVDDCKLAIDLTIYSVILCHHTCIIIIYSFIPGMCACRCSGSTAVRYGSMRENVLNLTAVLSDGSIIKTGSRARKSSAGMYIPCCLS